MRISTTETKDLSKEHAMVWIGHIFPTGHLISWICIHKSMIKLKEHTYSREDFDRIPQGDEVDQKNIKDIRAECFPCRSCLVSIPAANGKCEIAGMIPESEIERVGM